MADHNVQKFISGTHSVIDPENIPIDAAQDSKNWITKDGIIELVRGREIVGTEGTVGTYTNDHWGYKADGTKVHFRKAGTKVQVDISGTWTDVITGLTETAKYTFSNYQSLAGTFVYVTGIDGLYKIHTANPTSYTSMYNSTKNFKGQSIIVTARMHMWDLPNDKTGHYGSYIDAQDSTVYTTVSGEATTSLTGTLAFKGGGATRTCFGVVITLTGTGEVYTDNNNGVLTGSLGGTGTINYTSGAYTMSAAGVGTATYQWEDSNIKGITDFTKSSTRLAGEGFMFRQDEGGDAIQQILVAPDGSFISLKSQSAYQLTIDNTDTNATNLVFRKDIGVLSKTGAVSTGFGIIFMNTANPNKPELTILEKNPIGDNLVPRVLFPQFQFSNFVYDEDTVVDFFDRYVVISCKSVADLENDTLLMGNVNSNTVDRTYYGLSCISKNEGYLYGGSPFELTSYRIFVGFDDLDNSIDNYWTGKDELYDSESLKKFRKLRLKGYIQAGQSYQVYVNYDNTGFQLVGTILSSGSYVDYNDPIMVGAHMVGDGEVGGSGGTTAFSYFTELKMKCPKFRKRTIKIIALGIGYVSIDTLNDWDILKFENRLPKGSRQKQHVDLSGSPVNEDYFS